jgi:ankyrin repeat protein
MTDMRKFVLSLDYEGLRKVLATDPTLANKGVPFDEKNTALAHPLHRICDAVFMNTITDEQGVKLARIFLGHGASVDGFGLIDKRDTPLIAAASLCAEEVGILYIDNGANIHHPGTHGATALHWAAWVGRDKLVDKLIRSGADIHRKCIDFDSTPLGWALNGTKSRGRNRHRQEECIRLLREAGADEIPLK